MIDSRAWLGELASVSPRVNLMFLRSLARLLAAGPDVDPLLIVADGLAEEEAELRYDSHDEFAAEVAALARVLRAEVEVRAAARGSFW